LIVSQSVTLKLHDL